MSRGVCGRVFLGMAAMCTTVIMAQTKEGSGRSQTGEPVKESSLSMKMEDHNTWLITGPIRLRGADAEEPGELEIKNIFGWSTTRSGGDDDFSYELELEYGLVENHELILSVEFEDIGDGRQDGNGDTTLGWHWKLLPEKDLLPAFAIRNFVTFPTGTGSSGVDYELRGLFTKTLIDGKMRGHFNPFLISDNGDEEDIRNFRWGALAGVDYRVSDSLVLIGDYRYESGEEEHTRDNHALDLGFDWRIDDRQTIGFVTEIGIDGDTHGPALEARISYILAIGG